MAPNVTLLPESETARSQQVPQLNPEALFNGFFYLPITLLSTRRALLPIN